MKKIVLTGSNGQLGKNFIDFLKNKDCFIYALDLNHSEKLNLDNIKYIKIDITNKDEVEEFYKNNSDCNILINNAGIGVFTPFEERTKDEFFEVMSVNMYGTFLMSQQALKFMKKVEYGKIVNIASVYGVVSSDPRIYGNSGRNNSEVYSATKAGVIQMTRYMAAHFGKYNIQVNAISPGGIFNNQENFFVKQYTDRVPMERMAVADDLNSALELLISDNSNYINGQNIIVDGGFSSW
jgi:NAD(P)-dependent dehydrogenase (short-subunit alcohol dehydrogenase family)